MTRRAAAWCLTLVASVWLLSSWRLPLDHPDPVVAAFAVLRVVALGLSWYLVAVTVAGLLARATRVAALVRGVDVLTLPPVRRLLHASLGAGMTIASVAGPAAAAPGPAARPDPGPPVIRKLDSGGHSGALAPPMSSSPSDPRPGAGPPVIRRIAERAAAARADPPSPAPVTAHPTPTPTPTSAPVPPPPPARHAPPDPGGQTPPDPAPTSSRPDWTPPAPAPTTAGAGATWTVAPGENFWSIAESVLQNARGHPPSDAETAPYWARLIDANRHRLPDPRDPDLLFTGTVLDVPPP